MATNHTPEPWVMTQSAYSSKLFGSHTGFNIDSQTRRDICNITLNNAPGIPEDERRANARRIVACVNACAGIRIEDLEAVPLEFGLMGSLERLQLQNTELLEALKNLHVAAWEQGCTALLSDELKAARAAIAKAEGNHEIMPPDWKDLQPGNM